MSGCEWDPETGEAAEGDSPHHLSSRAVYSVGRGRKNFHICVDCADLPKFRRFKRRWILLPQEQRERLERLLG